MSTSRRTAAMPSRTWAMSLSSGPRTAATMQNSVAPVAAVCLAASTRARMSSHTARTGEVNTPDWEQKWQSSGQPPVLMETMPSTSTSGPHHRIRTSCASCSACGRSSSGSPSTARTPASSSPCPSSRTTDRARSRIAAAGLGGMGRTLQGVLWEFDNWTGGRGWTARRGSSGTPRRSGTRSRSTACGCRTSRPSSAGPRARGSLTWTATVTSTECRRCG